MLKKKKRKKTSKIHNNIEQDWDKAKNGQKLDEYDFLELHAQMGAQTQMEEMNISKLYSVSEIPHSHKIKASIFKILTWSNEEIVLLNKYYTVFHCPMFSWERCSDLRKELLSIYWKIRAIRTLFTTRKTKYFIHVSCREKTRLVRDALAVYIWLE